MAAVVLYESMFGNTRRIAEAIADGIQAEQPVIVVGVQEATPDILDDADLVVVGGPTHVHSMSRPTSRKAAKDTAAKPDSGVQFEPRAEETGLREWLAAVVRIDAAAAAFDTRMPGPPAFTGRASKRIARLLIDHGAGLVDTPQSYLVSKQNILLTGELERAHQWGQDLGRRVAVAGQPTVR